MQNMSEDAIGLAVMLIMIVVYLFALGLALANYILQSLGLYRLADLRKIPNAWLAWIPVGNLWMMGALVDHHSRLKGIDRKWRFILPILVGVTYGGLMLLIVVMFVMIFSIGFQAIENPEVGPEVVLPFFLCFFLIYFVVLMVAMALSYCQIVCLYKIYEEMVPEKAVKYFLLSMLVPLAAGICLLKCKSSPIGIPMAPAYQPPMAPPVYPPEQPAAESVPAANENI